MRRDRVAAPNKSDDVYATSGPPFSSLRVAHRPRPDDPLTDLLRANEQADDPLFLTEISKPTRIGHPGLRSRRSALR